MTDEPQHDARDLSDRELLLQTYDMTKRVHSAVFGNGHRGLVERVTRMEVAASLLVIEAGWAAAVIGGWIHK